jgi:undecaprenyl-diphosphatase
MLKPTTVRKFILSALGLWPMILPTFGATAAVEPTPPPAATAAAELTMRDAMILGVVEGVTEFLPISSTGHLIIASHFLGLESEQPLTGKGGGTLWYKKPSAKNPAGVPLTLKLAADTYNVVIQFGAIGAVALLYWAQLRAMARGLRGRDPAGRRLLIVIMIAFVPAAVIGLLAHDWIDTHLFSVPAVIVAQVAGAALMLYAEAWRKQRTLAPKPELALTVGQAARIGLLQCVAMWPGTSRSMMTIVGGYFSGLDPRRSAEFSFLLGFVTLSAATLFKSYKSGAAMIDVFGWSHVILGAVVAAVTAALAVRFLVDWLTRHGLALFAWYRLIVAAVLGGLLAAGFFK